MNAENPYVYLRQIYYITNLLLRNKCFIKVEQKQRE
jgi:hypothetical protein